MNGMTDIKDGFSQTMLDDFKALADEQYLGIAPPVDNDYLEPVNIPVYDSGDASHCLIGTDGDWNNTTLNDGTWKHFYVPPGSYTSRVTLTADGTSGDRRSISLHNGNDIHPASMAEGEQANVRIHLTDASYWDIDRMSNIDDTSEPSILFISGSSYNTINRLHMENYYYGVIIRHECNYNTVQNSYLSGMSLAGRLSDNVGLAISPNDFGNGGIVYGTKFINNDIRSANDGVQLVIASNDYDNINFPDTVVDSNRMWYDIGAQTDGAGNPIEGGDYQIGEQPGWDIKGGSNDPLRPVTFTNNIVWGAREGDPTQSQGSGSLWVGHAGSQYVIIEDNIFFDGFMIGGWGSNNTINKNYSAKDGRYNNNIHFDMNNNNPEPEPYLNSMLLYDHQDMTNDRNTFVNMHPNNNWLAFQNNINTVTCSNNLVIDVIGSIQSNPTEATGNYYYDVSAEKILATGTEFIYPTVAEANMTDYSFQYEIFTTAPKSMTLTGVISTASSPHYGVAGSDIT